MYDDESGISYDGIAQFWELAEVQVKLHTE